MSKQETPSPAPASRVSQERKRQRSVLIYISVLFLAAFLLLFLSFMMERRQNAENLSELNNSLTGLQNSVSAMQSVQQLYEEHTALLQQAEELEDKLEQQKQETNTLKREKQEQAKELENMQKSLQAMDWFWQINEAYSRGRNTQCRKLIQSMAQAGLSQENLPRESVTDTGRFSPYDRYMEIYQALY